jgi:hypothetical protein
MQGIKWTGLLLSLLCCSIAQAQVTGGQNAFQYLTLTNSPHVSALGGISVANPDNDISLALQNPSLMRPDLHNELELNYNDYYAGISVMNLQYGYNVPEINTAFALGVQYLNYGTFAQTDALGNQYGDFHANDYAISLAASRSYLERWRYGATVKWAQSSLYDQSASAALMDVGVTYVDTANLLDIGVVAKNMGFMIKRYNTTVPTEPLPFDLQMGISKKFKHLPLRLFATFDHLYEWDIRYDNPADMSATNLLGTTDSVSDKSAHFGDKLFRHVILGGELSFAKRVVITVSYNDLHRQELELQDRTGVTGFSFGLGVNLNKFQIHYARSYYTIVGAYNEFGITMCLNKLFGLGAGGERIHWNDIYPDWMDD